MKILVTGATGFIGNCLVQNLKKEKNQVSIVIRDKTKNHIRVKEKADSIYYGTIDDLDFMKRVISESEPEVIFHLASSAIVRMCARNPLGAYQNNVMGTVKLLEAIRTCGDTVKKVVVSTSDKVYGHAMPPYDENTAFMPKYTYEATKACQDFACQNYFHNYDVPVVIARMSNIYGPGDPNDSRLIPKTINNIFEKKPPIIYEDVASFERDFVFIDDAISALKILAKNGTAGEAYCVGSPDASNISIEEIVKKILSLMDSDLSISYQKRSAAFKEIQSQSINSSKIQSIGWSPEFNLDQGLLETIDFYRKKTNSVKNVIEKDTMSQWNPLKTIRNFLS